MVTNSDLKTHWGISAARLSQLRKEKAMPNFDTLADADAWRAVNAPARQRISTTQKAPAPAQETPASIIPKNVSADLGDLTIPEGLTTPERIKAESALVRKLALSDLLAAKPELRRAAIICWSEAQKRGSEAEQDATEMAKRQRTILEREEAEFIAGQVLQALIRKLDDMDVYIAPRVVAAVTANGNTADVVAPVIKEAMDQARHEALSAIEAITMDLRAGTSAAEVPAEIAEADKSDDAEGGQQ